MLESNKPEPTLKPVDSIALPSIAGDGPSSASAPSASGAVDTGATPQRKLSFSAGLRRGKPAQPTPETAPPTPAAAPLPTPGTAAASLRPPVAESGVVAPLAPPAAGSTGRFGRGARASRKAEAERQQALLDAAAREKRVQEMVERDAALARLASSGKHRAPDAIAAEAALANQKPTPDPEKAAARARALAQLDALAANRANSETQAYGHVGPGPAPSLAPAGTQAPAETVPTPSAPPAPVYAPATDSTTVHGSAPAYGLAPAYGSAPVPAYPPPADSGDAPAKPRFRLGAKAAEAAASESAPVPAASSAPAATSAAAATPTPDPTSETAAVPAEPGSMAAGLPPETELSVALRRTLAQDAKNRTSGRFPPPVDDVPTASASTPAASVPPAAPAPDPTPSPGRSRAPRFVLGGGSAPREYGNDAPTGPSSEYPRADGRDESSRAAATQAAVPTPPTPVAQAVTPAQAPTTSTPTARKPSRAPRFVLPGSSPEAANAESTNSEPPPATRSGLFSQARSKARPAATAPIEPSVRPAATTESATTKSAAPEWTTTDSAATEATPVIEAAPATEPAPSVRPKISFTPRYGELDRDVAPSDGPTIADSPSAVPPTVNPIAAPVDGESFMDRVRASRAAAETAAQAAMERELVAQAARDEAIAQSALSSEWSETVASRDIETAPKPAPASGFFGRPMPGRGVEVESAASRNATPTAADQPTGQGSGQLTNQLEHPDNATKQPALIDWPPLGDPVTPGATVPAIDTRAAEGQAVEGKSVDPAAVDAWVGDQPLAATTAPSPVASRAGTKSAAEILREVEEQVRAAAARREAETVERIAATRRRALEAEALRRERERAQIEEIDRRRAERAESRRQSELEEKRVTEAARVKAELARAEAIRAQEARLEAVRAETERAHQARLDAERIVGTEIERAEQARLDAERIENERAEQARLEEERAEAARAQAARLEAEITEAARLEAERAAIANAEAEQREAARQANERAEQARLEAEQAEARRIEAERAETERLEAQRLETERLETERLETERAEAEQAELRRVEALRTEAARVEAAHLLAAREAAEHATEQAAAEQVATEQATELTRAEAEQSDTARVEALLAESQRAEAERAEAARVEATRAAAAAVEAQIRHTVDRERREREQRDAETIEAALAEAAARVSAAREAAMLESDSRRAAEQAALRAREATEEERRARELAEQEASIARRAAEVESRARQIAEREAEALLDSPSGFGASSGRPADRAFRDPTWRESVQARSRVNADLHLTPGDSVATKFAQSKLAASNGHGIPGVSSSLRTPAPPHGGAAGAAPADEESDRGSAERGLGVRATAVATEIPGTRREPTHPNSGVDALAGPAQRGSNPAPTTATDAVSNLVDLDRTAAMTGGSELLSRSAAAAITPASGNPALTTPPVGAAGPVTHYAPPSYGHLVPTGLSEDPESTRERRSDPYETSDVPVSGRAISALLTAILGIFIVSLPLVGAARREIRLGARRGGPIASLALLISLVWVAVAGYAGYRYYQNHYAHGLRDAAGVITRSGDVSPDELRAGDCLNVVAASSVVDTVSVVPCTEVHRAQVYLTTGLPGITNYTGASAVNQRAGEVCLTKLAGYVGHSKTVFTAGAISPSALQWSEGWRGATCIVTSAHASVGDLRGAH